MTIPNVGESFRHFRILARAGEGGMGVVFHALDTRLGRDVALKFLTGITPTDTRAVERMQIEARSLAAVNHANIVTLYDIDEADGSPFLVMEWVPGRSLADASVPRPIGEAEFLRITVPVAEALAAAHTRGVVHRDLKPANVLLGEDGAVKLADFGLAKFRDARHDLTRTAGVVGTVAYMSPEQILGVDVGPASDVFSFGALAYELLTGRPPFGGDHVASVLFAIAHEPHVPIAERRADLSADLAFLVERCLRKRPSERPSGGADLALAVQQCRTARSDEPDPSHPRSSSSILAPGKPRIRFCRTADGIDIAYATHGTGTVLVRVLGWFTHLEMEWEWPALRRIWERLAETHTVVRYDGRGIGLSAPWADDFTEETRQSDLDAVIRATGADRVALYGISEGGWTAARYAAEHPDRVSHLIVYGSYSRGARFRPGYDPEETRALEVLMRKGWGRDTPEYRQIFTTAYFGADADPGLVSHFNRLQRAAADGDTAARYQESLHRRDDARDVFARIRTPTLVIHCRDDQVVSFEEGRLIASIVPDAQFLLLPTGTHYFPVDDAVTDAIASAIRTLTA